MSISILRLYVGPRYSQQTTKINLVFAIKSSEIVIDALQGVLGPALEGDAVDAKWIVTLPRLCFFSWGPSLIRLRAHD